MDSIVPAKAIASVTPRRRSIRLPGYDYRQPGAYFLTLVTHNRACLFGQVVHDQAVLSELGAAARGCWTAIPRHCPGVALDLYVVMPNHVHGIIVISGWEGEAFGAAELPSGSPVNPNASPLRSGRPVGTQPGSLGAIVQNFKAVSARRINALRATPGAPVWQRNYWERIIRNEDELNRARQYIMDNPLRWALDRENPSAVR